MSGWLLILSLLVLGGVLSTLGDRLGSRVGKARLSLFNLRPRHTAVVITVLTGSLISAVSLGLMLLVSQQLRVGLFELDQIQNRLQASRSALARSQRELAEAEAGRRQSQQQLRAAQQRAAALRREVEPLLAQRRQLLADRDRLTRDVLSRDADIRRNKDELAQVQRRIDAGARELRQLENNLIALRRGDVVIGSGQPLATAKVTLQQPDQARSVINAVLQQANRLAFQRVLPGQPPDRQILLVPRNDITRLEEMLAKPGSWVVSILSAANVLRGEQQVLAFPDLRPNRPVVRAGDVLASTTIEGDLLNPDGIARRLNLLLAAAYAKAQRLGTLVDGLQFDAVALNQLNRALAERPAGSIAQLEAVALGDADTPDPIAVEFRWVRPGPPLPRRP
ncbi:MAG: DUF3084 domain-containing protein [Cyanobacteriota bacterium]|nr:DUF3084 domain-containing protein [Cyanobacteriota bacterium]